MRYWKWNGIDCKVVSRSEMIEIAGVDEWFQIEPVDIYLSRDGCIKVYIFQECDKWYAVIKYI